MRLFRSCLLVVLLNTPITGYGGQNPDDEQPPAEPVPQPIAFSHRQHAELGMDCSICHRTTETASQAGLPDVAHCMACHDSIAADMPAIKKLAGYSSQEKPVPWERVYRVPYYVFFSHQNHRQAGFDCAVCHGNVAQQEVLKRETDISMDGCVACHQKHDAALDCHLCHALDQ